MRRRSARSPEQEGAPRAATGRAGLTVRSHPTSLRRTRDGEAERSLGELGVLGGERLSAGTSAIQRSLRRAFVQPRGPRTAGKARARSLAWECPSRLHLGRRRTTNPYVVGEVLGRGGCGVVHRARDTRSGREVALKTLVPPYDPLSLARFEREARALCALDHPHVVPALEVLSGPPPALVMPLVDGGSLQDRLKAGPLPLEEVLDLGQRLAEALSYVHRCGVLHRDLKPANVLVHQGRPLLADFGLARGAPGHTLTATGEILGTPGYLAPEQAEGREVTEATDVYGLGALLFALLTGRAPFERPTAMEALASVVQAPAPSARALRPRSPPGSTPCSSAAWPRTPASATRARWRSRTRCSRAAPRPTRAAARSRWPRGRSRRWSGWARSPCTSRGSRPPRLPPPRGGCTSPACPRRGGGAAAGPQPPTLEPPPAPVAPLTYPPPLPELPSSPWLESLPAPASLLGARWPTPETVARWTVMLYRGEQAPVERELHAAFPADSLDGAQRRAEVYRTLGAPALEAATLEPWATRSWACALRLYQLGDGEASLDLARALGVEPTEARRDLLLADALRAGSAPPLSDTVRASVASLTELPDLTLRQEAELCMLELVAASQPADPVLSGRALDRVDRLLARPELGLGLRLDLLHSRLILALASKDRARVLRETALRLLAYSPADSVALHYLGLSLSETGRPLDALPFAAWTAAHAPAPANWLCAEQFVELCASWQQVIQSVDPETLLLPTRIYFLEGALERPRHWSSLKLLVGVAARAVPIETLLDLVEQASARAPADARGVVLEAKARLVVRRDGLAAGLALLAGAPQAFASPADLRCAQTELRLLQHVPGVEAGEPGARPALAVEVLTSPELGTLGPRGQVMFAEFAALGDLPQLARDLTERSLAGSEGPSTRHRILLDLLEETPYPTPVLSDPPPLPPREAPWLGPNPEVVSAQAGFSPAEFARWQQLSAANQAVELLAEVFERFPDVTQDAEQARAAAEVFGRLSQTRWERALLERWAPRDWRTALRLGVRVARARGGLVLPAERSAEAPPTALRLAEAEAALLLLARGDDASAVYAQLEALQEQDLSPEERLQALRLELRAQVDFAVGRAPKLLLDEALAALAAAGPELTSTQAVGLLRLSAALSLAVCDYDRSARCAREALDYEPRSTWDAALLAYALTGLRRHTEALALGEWVLRASDVTEVRGLAALATCCAVGAGRMSTAGTSLDDRERLRLAEAWVANRQLDPSGLPPMGLCMFARQVELWDELARLSWHPLAVREPAPFHAMGLVAASEGGGDEGFEARLASTPAEFRAWAELLYTVWADRERTPQPQRLRELASALVDHPSPTAGVQVARALRQAGDLEGCRDQLAKLRQRFADLPLFLRDLDALERRLEDQDD
ncbi:MAG: serine/threonine-protein kinase [Planctomycetota bacterium]